MALLIITSQFIITLVSVSIFTISREASYVVESCRERREIFYEFDYFHDFDYHSLVSNTCSHSYSSYYACYILKICYIVSMINIVDIFIIFRIAISVKSKTLSVTSLLTSKALEQRKR